MYSPEEGGRSRDLFVSPNVSQRPITASLRRACPRASWARATRPETYAVVHDDDEGCLKFKEKVLKSFLWSRSNKQADLQSWLSSPASMTTSSIILRHASRPRQMHRDDVYCNKGACSDMYELMYVMASRRDSLERPTQLGGRSEQVQTFMRRLQFTFT